jgi:hypothetical protein
MVGPVYLEPIAHKYIHRETNKKYSSVTTTLLQSNHILTWKVYQPIVKQQDSAKTRKIY